MSTSLLIGKIRFTMRRAKEPDALDALREAHEKSGLDVTVDEDGLDALALSSTLDEGMRALGWELKRNVRGVIRGITRVDERDRGHERRVLEALGPHVAPGSYIEMILATDPQPLRFDFDGDRCKTRAIATLSHDDEEDDSDEAPISVAPPPSRATYVEALRAIPAERAPYSPRATYTVGDWVEHPKFGAGFVRALGEATKVVIAFESGDRTLIHTPKAASS